MEQPPPSILKSALDALERDLKLAMSGKPPPNLALTNSNLGIEAQRFGSVFFGPLDWFANGDPHYGMVTNGASPATAPPLPEVSFAPLTSQKVSGAKKRKTVFLPPGTLPTDKHGKFKASRILLYLRIPIAHRAMRKLVDKRDMWYVQTLKDLFLKEASAILANR